MTDQPTEETQFVVDEVSNVIKEAIETTIGGNSYTVSEATWRNLFFWRIQLASEFITSLFLAPESEPVDKWSGGVLPCEPH